MANRYAGTPISSEWDAVQRRRAVNQALLEQAMADTGGTEYVRGGRLGPTQAVPYSWGTGAGQIGKALIAGMGDKKAREQESALAEKYDVNRKESVDKFMGMLQGTPAGFEGGSIPGRYNEAQEPDMEGAMVHGSTDPYMQSPGMQNLVTAMMKPKPRSTFKTVEKAMGGGMVQDVGVYDGVPGADWGAPYEDKSGQQINIGDAPPNVTAKGTEKYWTGVGEGATDLKKSAGLARKQNFQLDRLKLALSEGSETGFGQDLILKVKKLGQTIGFDIGDPTKMGGQEVITSVGNKLALLIRNPESGMGLPGSTSNRDLVLLDGTVPGLGKTLEGNLMLADIAEKMNDLEIEVSSYATKLIYDNGGEVPLDYEMKMEQFVANYEMLTEEERAKIETLTASGGAATPPTPPTEAVSPVPAGISQEEWDEFTPEEKALWPTK